MRLDATACFNRWMRFALLGIFGLLNEASLTAQRGGGLPVHIVKPNMNDTVKLNVYVDNWFKLYINGKLAAVDSIEFMPHNIVSVDVLPEFPMTIAVMARDNANAIT